MNSSESTSSPPVRRSFRPSALLLLLAALAGPSCRPRSAAVGPGAGDRQAEAPTVAVQKVSREDLAQTLSLSAEFRPWQEVALHAKVSGFVQSIAVDVGDRVREGQVIAKLDVPELQDELEKAIAASHGSEQEVIRAEAANAEAHLGYTRLQGVAKEHPKLVAQQELDVAYARDATTASGVAAARQKVEESRAEINRVRAMISYTTMTAPFGGTISRRLADPGALIQAGTSSTTQPLVEIVDDRRLRLVFPVPESAVPLVRVGSAIQVRVRALQTTFSASVSRFSGKVDRATRNMATEADVDNPTGKLKPGMIAEVSLVIRESKGAIAVPVQAVAAGEHPSVMLVGPGNILEQRGVQLGLETPERDEILAGLQPGGLVLVGARTGVQAGQKVTPKLTAPAPQ